MEEGGRLDFHFSFCLSAPKMSSSSSQKVFEELLFKALSEPPFYDKDDDDDDKDAAAVTDDDDYNTDDDCEEELVEKLFLAAESNDLESAKILVLVHGVNPNARDAYGFTPIHIAAEAGNCEFIETMVSLGANINARENNGYTIMADRAACGGMFTKVLRTFVNLKGDLNLPDFKGNTTLHNIIKYNIEYMKAVIDAGADIFIKNKRGENVLAYARRVLSSGPTKMEKINFLVERFIKAAAALAALAPAPAPAALAPASSSSSRKRDREEEKTTVPRRSPRFR